MQYCRHGPNTVTIGAGGVPKLQPSQSLPMDSAFWYLHQSPLDGGGGGGGFMDP